ncbi:hypothetical protein SAMN02745174_02500 [Cetobacterium ceti]|uniref:Uncharacterized protein n=1 Tax=Cetobacterium ceti TaxID=180163 RepID=A0A1T4QYI2_9FUSO|nr:hypothetical protein [Cetobacterium ceti]SKA08647.1 hypothetical protein SAMN02745174_02500 [Cetobacterium ceti]
MKEKIQELIEKCNVIELKESKEVSELKKNVVIENKPILNENTFFNKDVFGEIASSFNVSKVEEKQQPTLEKTLVLTNAEPFISDKNNLLIYKNLFFRNGNIYNKTTGEKIGAYSKLVAACTHLGKNPARGKNFVIKTLKSYINKKLTDKEIEELVYYSLETYPCEALVKYLYKYSENGIDKTIEHNVKRKVDFIYANNKKFLEEEFYTIDNLKNDEFEKINIPLKNFILTFVEYTEKIRDTKDLTIYPVVEPLFIEIDIVDKENVDDELHKYLKGEEYDKFYDGIYYKGIKLFVCKDTSNEENIFLFPNNFFVADENQTNRFRNKIMNILKYANKYFKAENKDIEMFIPSSIYSQHIGKKVLERKPCAVKGHTRHYKSGLVTLVRPHLRNGVGLNYGVCVKI